MESVNNIYIKINIEQERILTKSFYYKNIIVPEGFIFDGNSIPRIFRPFLGQYEYIQASCVHDYLYDKKSDIYRVSRKEADNIYKEILDVLSIHDNDKLFIKLLKIIRNDIVYCVIRAIGFRRFKK